MTSVASSDCIGEKYDRNNIAHLKTIFENTIFKSFCIVTLEQWGGSTYITVTGREWCRFDYTWVVETGIRMATSSQFAVCARTIEPPLLVT